MTNANQPEPITPEQRQAWLVEYQALQQYNSSITIEYWTMAAIFIGISSVLLGGLPGAVLLSDSDIFQSLFQLTTTKDNLSQIRVFSIIILLLGAGIITILCRLKRWLKRFTFLQQINFQRMRQIELDSGMWGSWRVHFLDRKVPKCYDTLNDDELWNRLKKELGQDLDDPDDCKRLKELEKRKDVLIRLFRRYHLKKGCKKREYEASSNRHFNVIFCTLTSLWSLLLLSALFRLAATFVWIDP